MNPVGLTWLRGVVSNTCSEGSLIQEVAKRLGKTYRGCREVLPRRDAQTYLNGTQIQELNGPPSALEFSRLVHINRPVVFRNCFDGHDLPALSKWDDAYLCRKMADHTITVAVTPDGLADAVKVSDDGQAYFIEPYTEMMTMGQLLDVLRKPTIGHSSATRTDDIYYLQSQNGNLGSDSTQSETFELKPLSGDVPPDVPWVTEALDRIPDAVNLWIGDSRSITSVHSDPYENIYTVIRGQKHFTLLPPTEGYCLDERLYKHARYTRSHPRAQLSISPSSNRHMVSWASVDPTSSSVPVDAHPMHATLEPGDALYLPAGWWHHVRQTGEIVVAVNWWYDMEMRGMSWVWLTYLRNHLEDSASQDDET